MAILPKNQETSTSLSTSTAAASTPASSSKRRAPPSRRQALRHHSGSLSDDSASTTASSNSSSNSSTNSSTNSPTPKKTKTTRNRNRRNAKKNKKNNNNQQQQQQPELSAQEQARYVALDCEFVGIGPTGRTSMLARVSLVDWNGNIILDEYVKPTQPVSDYRTYVSGITPQHLQTATHTFDTIQPVVAQLLHNKILVGHGLKSDLHVLQIQHPWYDTRDTAKYEPFMQVRFDDGVLWPRKLKDLCASRPNLDIDAEFQQGAHCSVLDAIAALRLYQSVRVKWEKVMDYKKSKTLQITSQQQRQQQEQQLQRQDYQDDCHTSFDEFSHSDESSHASSSCL